MIREEETDEPAYPSVPLVSCKHEIQRRLLDDLGHLVHDKYNSLQYFSLYLLPLSAKL
jgi:hypothetical protein